MKGGKAYCREWYLEASDKLYKETSDGKRRQEILDAAFLAKQQFLIEEGHLELDDGTMAQASIPLGKSVKVMPSQVMGAVVRLLLKWQHHHLW